MKRIAVHHNKKEHIICVTSANGRDFYYQPVGTKKWLWLFQTIFSGSAFLYFRNYGRVVCTRSFSLTLDEMYTFKTYRNPKLVRLMDCIPSHVTYIIKILSARSQLFFLSLL